MNKIWIIARRELGSFFDSLIAYIMIAAFLGFSGFFTWLSGSDIFVVGQASLRSFFTVAYWTLFFFIPALTMRLLAEENKTGTIELLLTKAVTDRQIVIGKFLGTLILVMIAIAFTIPYYISLTFMGNMDHGATLSGYLGLVFLSGCYISIGIFMSSVTDNQIVAFLFALFVGLFFHILFGMIAGSVGGLFGSVADYLSLQTHFESIARGVIDSRDLIYFGSIIFLGLFLAEISLKKRNISGLT